MQGQGLTRVPWGPGYEPKGQIAILTVLYPPTQRESLQSNLLIVSLCARFTQDFWHFFPTSEARVRVQISVLIFVRLFISSCTAGRSSTKFCVHVYLPYMFSVFILLTQFFSRGGKCVKLILQPFFKGIYSIRKEFAPLSQIHIFLICFRCSFYWQFFAFCFCRYTGLPSNLRIITSGVREGKHKRKNKKR